MKSHCYFRRLLFLILPVSISLALTLCPFSPVFAGGGDDQFQKLNAQYKALVSSGLNTSKRAEAERLDSALNDYISSRGAKHSAEALMMLGDLHEKLFHKSGSKKEATLAENYYERIARDYPGDSRADNALLALGDLRRRADDDETGARAAYYEIIDRYEKSDSFAAAKERVGEGTRRPKVEKAAPKPSEKSSELPLPKEAAPEESEPNRAEQAPLPVKESHEIFTRPPTVQRPLIVIDAGHGGEDEGAIGQGDIKEKDVTLTLALMLDELLRDRLRARTVLTRTTDVFIPLAERTMVANKNNADLFVSIHTNASEYKTASGVETYYLDNTKDKSSLKLAERENRALMAGPSGVNADVGFMVSDLIQNAKLDDSISLAHQLQNSLSDTLTRYYRGINNLGVKKAPFYVLVGAHMPCVLVEVSFIDHPVEGERLADRRYQRLIAQALYQGVKAFFLKRS